MKHNFVFSGILFAIFLLSSIAFAASIPPELAGKFLKYQKQVQFEIADSYRVYGKDGPFPMITSEFIYNRSKNAVILVRAPFDDSSHVSGISASLYFEHWASAIKVKSILDTVNVLQKIQQKLTRNPAFDGAGEDYAYELASVFLNLVNRPFYDFRLREHDSIAGTTDRALVIESLDSIQGLLKNLRFSGQGKLVRRFFMSLNSRSPLSMQKRMVVAEYNFPEFLESLKTQIRQMSGVKLSYSRPSVLAALTQTSQFKIRNCLLKLQDLAMK